MKRKEYEAELRRLHGELVAMQEWVKASGAKVCVVFEGRDTAGKGGTIKAITERVSPRVFRVVALPAPTEREKSQMYVQRYIPHLPAAGEVVIFDRSWYNRAGVERVMGFCTEEQAKRFLRAGARRRAGDGRFGDHAPEVLARGQRGGADQAAAEPDRRSPQDLEAVGDGPQVLQPLVRLRPARDDMFAATDSAWAPWYVVHTDDKRRGRLNLITHLLEPGPLRAARPQEVHVAEAPAARWLHRAGPVARHIPTPF